MLELLTTNHMDKILDLFDGAQKEIKIISPFLTMSMAKKLCTIVAGKKISCTFITRFYLEDMINKANSIDALELMIYSGVEVYAVKKLHTKLYLFDGDSAILGSANFTNGGFKSNIELSLLLSGDKASEEVAIVSGLHDYFDDMLNKLKSTPEGKVSEAVIIEAKQLYATHLHNRLIGKATFTQKMYGALLETPISKKWIDEEFKQIKEETDPVCDMFKETEQVELTEYPFTIWLKFDGEGNDRLNAKEHLPMVSATLNNKTVYLSNYPFKVWSVKENDKIYIAALTTDKFGKNQPIIAGRGTLGAFSGDNYATKTMINQHAWMERYPWYVPIKDCEVLNTAVENGITMDSIWDALGSDTYMSSFGRNEDITAVSRKHYQKAHIRLSGNAKDYIDKKFDELKAKYGVINYHSTL